jgi:hypothetical protein
MVEIRWYVEILTESEAKGKKRKKEGVEWWCDVMDRRGFMEGAEGEAGEDGERRNGEGNEKHEASKLGWRYSGWEKFIGDTEYLRTRWMSWFERGY